MEDNILYFDEASFEDINGVQCFLLSDMLKKIKTPIKIHSIAVYGDDINQWTVKVVSDTGQNYQKRNKFDSENGANTFVNSIISTPSI